MMYKQVPDIRVIPPIQCSSPRPEFLGMENIPTDERPLLFVGNHTIYGLFDMPIMIYEVRKNTGIALRGLAHPLHYMSAFGDLLARYGAVKVCPYPCPNTKNTLEPLKAKMAPRNRPSISPNS